MPFPKGKKNPRGGRTKGAANKNTLRGREAIAAFVEGNAARLESWLDAIAKDNPLAAFNAFMTVVEFHLPKIARQEITGKDGERLQLNVTTGVNLISQPVVEAEYKIVNQIEQSNDQC